MPRPKGTTASKWPCRSGCGDADGAMPSLCVSAWEPMLENLIDEFLAAEDLELLRLFTSADESRGDIEFFLNGDCYASLS